MLFNAKAQRKCKALIINIKKLCDFALIKIILLTFESWQQVFRLYRFCNQR